MTKQEYLKKYRDEKPLLCESCAEKKPCMFSHFGSKLVPIDIPEKIECSYWNKKGQK